MSRNRGEVTNLVSLTYFSRWNAFYYPTALRREQITPKRSTNDTRDLYSRGLVRQVLSQRASDKLDWSCEKKNCSSKRICFLRFVLTEMLNWKTWIDVWFGRSKDDFFPVVKSKINCATDGLNQFALFSSYWDIYIAFKFIALACWRYYNLCKYIVF